MIQLNLPTGELLRLKPAAARKFRGTRIPGSVLHQAGQDRYIFYDHEFRQSHYCIAYRSISCQEPFDLIITEKVRWLRFETVLNGELQVKDQSGRSIQLLPGQYHITQTPAFRTSFMKDHGCCYFCVYYSPEFLNALGLPTPILPVAPRPLPRTMLEMIYEMLDNPFSDEWRPFYYSNCIRELLFAHGAYPPFTWPGELTEKQVASMHEVDRYIAENLDRKITIRYLAKMAGTNSFFLKKAYEQVFGIGIFPRLIQRRMERAKFLLEKTDKPLKDICEMAGYETLAGFITEFRKRFGVTPNGWRKTSRGV